MVCANFRTEVGALTDFAQSPWRGAAVHSLSQTWRGDDAPTALVTTARLLWTPTDLWIGFECAFTELDVDADPDPSVERYGLWERDVCEAFVQSAHESGPESYKEFEVAPTGQWFDVAVRQPRVALDWGWNSGLLTSAAIDRERRVWRATLAVPFSAFGGAPQPGEAWRVNLFRIARLDGRRHYLALAPTGTNTPDFHVPSCFVPLRFTGE